ncbi:MAG: hypothetical protein IPP90_02325 [Gemmatimonadaceae bacterium]|nr:hypothetical protein [Gemmatimonadaceae bacterium]
MNTDEIWGIWDLGHAGVAVVAGRVHAGRYFDVYLLNAAGQLFALKVPLASPRSDDGAFVASRTLGGVSTVWNVTCTAGERALAAAADQSAAWPTPVSSEELLRSEAQQLEAYGARWHAGFVSFRHQQIARYGSIPALVTSWQHGVQLDALTPNNQRALIPRLLPMLWRLLADTLHGDLHGSNLIVAPDQTSVALIDPGARVLRQRGRAGASEGADALTFVTTPEVYPVLPPYYLPHCSLSAGLTLREHWEGFVRSMTLSDQARPFRAGTNVIGRAMSRTRGRFLADEVTTAGEPHPADLLAIGVLYYQALTGRHPFAHAFSIPAWAGLTTTDDRVDGGDALSEKMDSAVVVPSTLNAPVSPAEDALALALLDLQVTSYARMVDLTRALIAA